MPATAYSTPRTAGKALRNAAGRKRALSTGAVEKKCHAFNVRFANVARR
jgi:hypothetical protein